MKNAKKWLITVLAVVILGTFSVGAAMADSSSSTAPSPIAPPSSQSQQELYKLFLSNLASELGIDEDTLTDALKTAYTETVNQEVEDGAITQEQADKILDRIDNGMPFFGMMGPGPGGPGGPGGHGPGGDQQQSSSD